MVMEMRREKECVAIRRIPSGRGNEEKVAALEIDAQSWKAGQAAPPSWSPGSGSSTPYIPTMALASSATLSKTRPFLWPRSPEWSLSISRPL
ncbi:hypothetical protein AcV5_004157 [Taiwanofungus camphoratus]|nr:hypothetical protein AcW2_001247 [Antrodia cinnamomea]KAI0935854.1 hypothetical protein AcV5_004157 [Antrodia cinnamomea]